MPRLRAWIIALVASATGCGAEPPPPAAAPSAVTRAPARTAPTVAPARAETVAPIEEPVVEPAKAPPNEVEARPPEAPPTEASRPEGPAKVSMPRPKTTVRARHRPLVRSTTTTVCCRLPPEVITRVIRSNREQLAKCTEGAAPAQLSFVIAKDGSVHDASVSAGSDAYKACMQSALTTLRFPAPEGGEVKVVYPLAMDPMP